MPAFRSSISVKLFVAMSLVAGLVIIFLAVMITINMRTGFARYLAQAEISRFDRLHDSLVSIHAEVQPGWPQLRGDRRAWNDLVRAAVPPPPGAPPPRQTLGKRPPPRRIDPMRFGSRLVLLDADRNRVVGGSANRSVFVSRPIQRGRPEGEVMILGWLGLTAAAGPPSRGDALFLSDQLKTLLITSVVALCLCGFGAYFLSRQFLKPIRKLAMAGDRLSAGDYTIRLDDSRSDELGALVRQFNTLAENLEARDSVERKWISDTSHELKTPLAVLRAQVEAIQDGVHEASAARLSELHASIMRLSSLVSDLNSLANMREGQLATNIETENVSDIIAARLNNAMERMSGTEISMQNDVAPGLLLDCDRLRIGQLLDNLLENSTRYTTEPGKICISARAMSGGVEIDVEDTSPCPAPATRNKLFDRFYREELSRNRKHGGSGLGLSICREIVNAHRGQIALSASPLGGLKVSVFLPNSRSNDE
jgi:two-component system sensor histidine kinase BaeS